MATWTSEVKGRLGFGCMRFPDDGAESGYPELERMIDTFLEAGFNYFDTARPYHEGKSEVALRECLVKRHPRERYFLVDKLSTENWELEDEIDALLDAELETLGVEHLDLLLMHVQNAESYEKYQRAHAYEHTAAFKAAGKTRHVGISFHDTPEVLERILDEHPEIEAVQIQFNYADVDNAAVQSLGCYEVCEKRGLPCIVMEPLKGGSLVKLPPAAQDAIDALPNPEGLTNAAVALRFAASYPNNVVVLSSMGSAAQVEENTTTLSDPAPLADELVRGLQRVRDVLRSLGVVECTACRYCVGSCPQHIMIPELFACLNEQRVFGGWSPKWYYEHAYTVGGHGRASDCIQCGMCEWSCPQKLPVSILLEDVAAAFD